MSDTAWAIQAPHWASPPNFIHTGTVRDRREDVQAVIGSAWADEGMTAREGWKRAYRHGWRCVRVQVGLYHKAAMEARDE